MIIDVSRIENIVSVIAPFGKDILQKINMLSINTQRFVYFNLDTFSIGFAGINDSLQFPYIPFGDCGTIDHIHGRMFSHLLQMAENGVDLSTLKI